MIENTKVQRPALFTFLERDKNKNKNKSRENFY